MTIRSAPPASAHFPEIPVPAPAPVIGIPRATCSCRRISISTREGTMYIIPPSRAGKTVTGYPFPNFDKQTALPYGDRRNWGKASLSPFFHREHIEQPLGSCVGKLGVINIGVDLAYRDVPAKPALQGIEERTVGLGPVIRTAGRRDHRDPP